MVRGGKPEAPESLLTITWFECVRQQRITCCLYTDMINVDSIGKLLEENWDFHEYLNECQCQCFPDIIMSDVFHKRHHMGSRKTDCYSIL